MNEVKKSPVLFFVKNSSHQFGQVEKFLNKRGFKVIIETDIKTALDRILEENPEYIFLAWDHKNENIRLMPKTIYASCTSQVVPFIMSTQRDQIIQLESSGFENKLYPPLSGPAIMRVISKHEKKSQIFEQINKKTNEKKKESDTINVKSFFTDENAEGSEINFKKSNSLDNGARQTIANRSRSQLNKFMPQKKSKSTDALNAIIQNGIKAKMMLAIDEELNKYKKLSAEQKAIAKNNLIKVIEQQLAEDISSDHLFLAVEEEVAKLNDLTADEQQQAKDNLIVILEIELAKATTEMEAEFAKSQNGAVDVQNDKDLSNVTMSEQISRDSKALTKEQIEALDESFEKIVKPEMLDTIEAFADQEAHQTDLTTTTQIYILIVQELEWTGYLAVASESYLDPSSAQDILNEWVKKMIRIEQINQIESDEAAIPDAVLMEIRVPKVDFADLCSYKSEFFKDIVYENKKTMIGFFSFSPYQVINSVHSAFDMLELPIEFLQPNKNLPFDVNLWLQENKKFILYIRPGSFLEEAQLERLQKRNLKYIFSQMEYELPLLKYKAIFNIKALIESYNSIKGPKK